MSTTVRALLAEHDACESGVSALGAMIDLDAPLPCTPAWAIAVLAGEPSMRPYVGWAVGHLCAPAEVGVVAGADLRGADLCGANLGDANLSGADLCGADLCAADLWGARRNLDDAPIPGWAVADGRLVRA